MENKDIPDTNHEEATTTNIHLAINKHLRRLGAARAINRDIRTKNNDILTTIVERRLSNEDMLTTVF